MEQPVWDVGVGYGLLMALFGVVHVFLAHFAIGGGLTMVLQERSARRRGDGAALEHVRRLSKFFAPTTLVVGALTGVGIWFIIGLLNPAATGVLIRLFVWGWAIEWTFFLVEILAAILYARGWDRLPSRTHEAIGWIYFVFAFLSLVVINGIVTFMLTPGGWPESGSFWDAFFNPTYAPSLVMRTAICLLLAGAFGLLVASRAPAEARARLVRREAALALGALAAAFLSFLWYRAALPAGVADAIGERLTIPATAIEAFRVLTVLLAAGLLAFLLLPRAAVRAAAIVVLAGALGWFGSFEWFRESARKPWAIPGVVYGNGVHVELASAGAARVPPSGLTTGDRGRDLFLGQCRSCHTLSGYNPVLPAFSGVDPGFAAGLLAGLHKMRAPMPPFVGDEKDREALGRWLTSRADPTPLAERARREGRDLGAVVYEARCGRCHVEGGFNDKLDSFEGLSEDDIRDAVESISFDDMPAFSGGEEERDALARHLFARAAKGGKP